jgi:hypothetical protein
MRELLVRWEWDFQQNPLFGAERVIAALQQVIE